MAARILAEFPEFLTDEQKVPNTLAELGRLTLQPDTNIIKLPNISASVAQLSAAIKELQARGYKIPDFPENPKTDEEKAIKTRYSKCLGSAVNPVLREGNSDRRAPLAVKNYARKNPHSMGEWSQASRTHVAHMKHGDFYHGEKSMTLDKARDVKMELLTKSGKTIVLKPKLSLLDGEIIDSMFMSKKALCEFYEEQMEDARKTGVMFSLHVKATMMKVSHPIVFGHCVRIFYKDAFEKHGKLFEELGVNVNNGMVNLYDKIATLPESQARRDRARPARLPRAPPGTGDGRFGQGHHQLPLAERRDRRRLDAGHDPHRRQDVGRRRPSEGHQGGDAGIAPSPASTRR